MKTVEIHLVNTLDLIYISRFVTFMIFVYRYLLVEFELAVLSKIQFHMLHIGCGYWTRTRIENVRESRIQTTII